MITKKSDKELSRMSHQLLAKVAPLESNHTLIEKEIKNFLVNAYDIGYEDGYDEGWNQGEHDGYHHGVHDSIVRE